MSKPILITSYINPDLDGCACIFAYEEFLKGQGVDARGGYFGHPLQDAVLVFEKFSIPMIESAKNINFDKVILVDTNYLNVIDSKVKPEKVIEIIDHHLDHSKDFPNAKIQIEMIGAAATMIAERFYENEVVPTKQAAQLMYLAIIAGTVNFKSWNTTDRDKNMAKWLNSIAKIRPEDIRELNKKNSQINKPLLDLLLDDFKYVDKIDSPFGITVWATVDLHDFVKDRKEEIIDAMKKIREDKKLKYIWHGSIDLEKGITACIAPDEETAKILNEAFGLEFVDLVSWVDHLVLRKEDFKKFEDYLKTRG